MGWQSLGGWRKLLRRPAAIAARNADHLLEQGAAIRSNNPATLGYKIGDDICIALDVASSEFYVKEKQRYVFKKSDGRVLTADQAARVADTRFIAADADQAERERAIAAGFALIRNGAARNGVGFTLA